MSSSPPQEISPPSPLQPSVINVTTPPSSFPLFPPTNASSEPDPSSPVQTRSGNNNNNNSALVSLEVGIGIGGAVVLVFVAVFVVWYKRRNTRRCAAAADDQLGFKDGLGGAPQNWQHNVPPSRENTNGLPPKFNNSPSNFQLSSFSSSVVPQPHSTSSAGSEKPNPTNMAYGNNKTVFTYEELANAADGFSQANLLGQGGFGYVHKGILPNGEVVAIKQLKIGSGQGESEFQAEVATISRVHHKHLVSLVGYCTSGLQRMLVYEFVPNNTLEFHLHGG